MKAVEAMYARKVDLTQADLVERLVYEPATGLFHWRAAVSRSIRPGDIAGGRTSLGYTTIKICRSRYMAHRLALLYVHGAWPAGEIDHINGDKTDNRMENLRDVDVRINQENRRGLQANNQSGAMGVCWSKKKRKWNASITVHKKHVHLGTFDDIEAASAAYLAAKRAMHEGCTI